MVRFYGSPGGGGHLVISFLFFNLSVFIFYFSVFVFYFFVFVLNVLIFTSPFCLSVEISVFFSMLLLEDFGLVCLSLEAAVALLLAELYIFDLLNNENVERK